MVRFVLNTMASPGDNMLNLENNEGRALAVIVSMLGPKGRAAFRTILLDCCAKDPPLHDARHTLEIFNEIERGFDQLDIEGQTRDN